MKGQYSRVWRPALVLLTFPALAATTGPGVCNNSKLTLPCIEHLVDFEHSRICQFRRQLTPHLKRHEVWLASAQPLKAQKTNKDALESGALYRWSKLRSEYAARANINVARRVVVYGGWYGPGWYWDPYWNFYSFLPANGILYSPFGWGFYSPGFGFGHPVGFGSGFGDGGGFAHGGGFWHGGAVGHGHGHGGGHGH